MDINQIAQMAGVSRATVSRYFNNGYVSEEKRAAIAKVVEKTGYLPSQQAKTLRTGRTNVVGVIIPKINSAAISRIVAGISQVLNGAGYQVLLANTDNDAAKEIQFLQLFQRTYQVDGVILTATVLSPEHRKALSELRVPAVVVDQKTAEIPCVYQDDFAAVYAVTEYVLTTSGNPAYIGVGEDDISAGRMRHAGFISACERRGVKVPPEHVVAGDFSFESGYACAGRLMEGEGPVDAIVCATDTIACGALAYLRDHGVSVPERVQVTGIGDGDLSRIAVPPLTTVHHHYKTTGAKAAEMLLEYIGGKEDAPRDVAMDFNVVIRSSTRGKSCCE